MVPQRQPWAKRPSSCTTTSRNQRCAVSCRRVSCQIMYIGTGGSSSGMGKTCNPSRSTMSEPMLAANTPTKDLPGN